MLADSRPSAASLLCCTLLGQARVLEEDEGRSEVRRAERREMRSDQARPVRSENVDGASSSPVLAPLLNEIEQARGNFADQRSRHGMHVAENFGGGLVDEPDLSAAVDDQQALAQVLDDVLRQVCKVCKIEVSLANQIFALPQRREDARRGGEGRARSQ